MEAIKICGISGDQDVDGAKVILTLVCTLETIAAFSHDKCDNEGLDLIISSVNKLLKTVAGYKK